MMPDFLTNLLLRSAGDPSTIGALQPRLPSLFEPLERPHEIPAPSSDPLVQENYEPGVAPSLIETPQSKAAGKASMIRFEHRRSSTLEEGNPWSVAQKGLLPEKQEAQPGTGSQLITEETVKRLEPTEKTISPEDTHEFPTNTPVLNKENVSHFQVDKNELPRAESLPIRGQTDEELPKTMLKSSEESRVNLIREEHIVENVVSPKVQPLPLKIELSPAAMHHPSLTSSRSAGRQSFEHDSNPEQQRIVEIHIGRIEVRAAPAPVHQPSKPRSATVMTLDEYLQRRNAGDR